LKNRASLKQDLQMYRVDISALHQYFYEASVWKEDVFVRVSGKVIVVRFLVSQEVGLACFK